MVEVDRDRAGCCFCSIPALGSPMMPNQSSRFFLLLSLLWIAIAPPSAKAKDVELQVGVVQRFGDETTEVLQLESTAGDRLNLTFLGGNGRPQTLTATKVELEIVEQPQAQPILQERLVLSDRATFETAEASAKEWQAKGIEVEVVQPGRWQVWAKRDVYKTPLLRRLLLQDLQARGEQNIYLETTVLKAVPRVSFVLNGYRYSREEIEITSRKNRVRVREVQKGQKSYLYAGPLKIQPNAYGNFSLVNRVPLETYLRGVVPHEIGPSAPYSAVEAQAILARTYALRNLRRFQADNYELCATVHCQVYRGLTGTVERADRAIAATRGRVLTHNNELIDALYSAATGGVTARFEDIWDGEPRPYLQPRIDAPRPFWNLSQQSLADENNFRRFMALKQGFNESDNRHFRWEKESSIESLTADLNRYLERIKHPLAGITRIVRMEVTARSASGRILTLAVQTDKGTVELQKTEARSALGPPRSTLFYLEPVLDSDRAIDGYRFIGGGFGHGVGLSQYGSYNLAKLGWTSAQILSFYYPGTTLELLNDSTVYYRNPQ